MATVRPLYLDTSGTPVLREVGDADTLVGAASGGSGGLPDGILSYGYTLTDAKTTALPAVSGGNQLLIYGAYIPNTDGATDISLDLYYYDSSITTERQLAKGHTVPADGVLFFGGLEPVIILDAGDEIRVNRGASGTGQVIFLALSRTAGTDYEQAHATLTTSAVSAFTAVGSGVTKRVVSVLAGNIAASGDHDYTGAWYDSSGPTTFNGFSTVTVPANSIIQAVADGFGPVLTQSDEWRQTASATSSINVISVAKVSS